MKEEINYIHDTTLHTNHHITIFLIVSFNCFMYLFSKICGKRTIREKIKLYLKNSSERGNANSIRAKFWKESKKNEDDFSYNIVKAKVKYIMPNIWSKFLKFRIEAYFLLHATQTIYLYLLTSPSYNNMNELRRAQNWFMTLNVYKVIQVFPKDTRK